MVESLVFLSDRWYAQNSAVETHQLQFAKNLLGIVSPPVPVNAVVSEKTALCLVAPLAYSLFVSVENPLGVASDSACTDDLQLWGTLLCWLSNREHLGKLVDIFLRLLADHAFVFGDEV